LFEIAGDIEGVDGSRRKAALLGLMRIATPGFPPRLGSKISRLFPATSRMLEIATHNDEYLS
jgi:hypothetical protein